jgi:hypothetical protein
MERIAASPPAASLEFGLEAARRRRAELRASISALEQALAAPAPGRAAAWCERVHVALVELSADLREHIDVTAGDDGLGAGVVTTTPRLSHAVVQLSREHGEMIRSLEDLLTYAGASGCSADHVRQRGTLLLGRLIRHRQREADLVYEAYQTDIGGQD